VLYIFWIIIVIFGFVYGGFVGGILCIVAPPILLGILYAIGESIDERNAKKRFTRVARDAGYSYWDIRKMKYSKKENETWDDCTAQMLRVIEQESQEASRI